MVSCAEKGCFWGQGVGGSLRLCDLQKVKWEGQGIEREDCPERHVVLKLRKLSKKPEDGKSFQFFGGRRGRLGPGGKKRRSFRGGSQQAGSTRKNYSKNQRGRSAEKGL